jgi:hypothetical protein
MALTNALIVIRHGEDLNKDWPTPNKGKLENWKKTVNEKWPVYEVKHTVVHEIGWIKDGHKVETANSLEVLQHGLSDVPQMNKDGNPKKYAGETQAEGLGVHLAKCLSDNGYAEVTKVVTKNPSVTNPNGNYPTPNPFDTVYPFIKSAGFKGGDSNEAVLLINPDNYKLVDPGLASMLDSGSLYPPNDGNGGSTLLCWDKEGLWGGDKFLSGSILGEISKKYLDSHYSLENEGPPGKGQTVYCFEENTPIEENKVTIYSFDGTDFSKIKSIKRKPST